TRRSGRRAPIPAPCSGAATAGRTAASSATPACPPTCSPTGCGTAPAAPAYRSSRRSTCRRRARPRPTASPTGARSSPASAPISTSSTWTPCASTPPRWSSTSPPEGAAWSSAPTATGPPWSQVRSRWRTASRLALVPAASSASAGGEVAKSGRGAAMTEPGDAPEPVGLLDGIATTRAIRRFRDDPVTDEQLATIMFAASRAPSGSNRQPFRFIVLRDGPTALAAKAALGRAARRMWGGKRATDVYDEGSGAEPDSPKARMARTMQHFVDHFDEVPAVILAVLLRYRDANPSARGSVYPACQNLLLAARAIGLGGVLTGFHALVEPELRGLLAVPD